MDEQVPQRSISGDGLIPWPLRLPDVTPLNFFIWGYVKVYVYKSTVINIGDFKTRLFHIISSVNGKF